MCLLPGFILPLGMMKARRTEHLIRQWKLCVFETLNWLSLYYIHPLIMTNYVSMLTCVLIIDLLEPIWAACKPFLYKYRP